MPQAYAAAGRALVWYKTNLLSWAEEAETFGAFPSAFMAMVDDEGNVAHYDGRLRVVDDDGALLAEFDGHDYADYIGEYTDESSFSSPHILNRWAWKTASIGSAPWHARLSPNILGRRGLTPNWMRCRFVGQLDHDHIAGHLRICPECGAVSDDAQMSEIELVGVISED